MSAERVESSRYRAVIELAALDKSDFDAVMRRILTTDSRELDVERVNCWTLEEHRIRCVAGFLRKEHRFESGSVIEAASCPSYFRALADDPIILADDARTDTRTREFTDSYLVPLGITSMMDVPVWVRGRLWGVICHEHVGPARRWTDAERDFAISIGHIVAMAVEARERADAERAAQISEFFMGVLSHDLRSPLASIRTTTELLRHGEVDSGRLVKMQRIERNVELMTRMIQQLLDFTRIRIGGGTLPVARTSADLGELVRRLVGDLPDDAANRVDVERSGDANGHFDVDRVWQALSNLLNNALDHGTPNARVRIVVDGDTDRICVKVSNRGAIPSDLLPVIFEPLRRQGSRTNKRGLGLGLFIVREVVASHDGSIVVHSADDEVTFTMTLPRSVIAR